MGNFQEVILLISNFIIDFLKSLTGLAEGFVNFVENFETNFYGVILPLFEGFGENCLLFLTTLMAAVPLGLLITLGTMCKVKVVKYIMKTFVWIIRGTPLMLQLFVVFYVPGLVWGVSIRDRMLAAFIAFSINYAAYFSEIYRGGIESIPKGQYEAGQVLAMTKTQVFFKVVLFQVIKRIVPPMGNEIITLIKDTSLARVIGVAEILMCAERFTSEGLIWPIFSTAIFFLLFNGALTLLLGYTEKKLNYYQ